MKKRILVAPLNWGLGHATRSIPIIRTLINNSYEPIIASDGVALELLKKEFPNLTSIELPSYEITYAQQGENFKLKLLKDSPKLLKAIKAEKKVIKTLVESLNLSGIISDNRLGVYSKEIPSVFITHQLNVLSGNTTWLSTEMHKFVIKKFSACWVPDVENEPNLSGKLGHTKNFKLPITYLGPLSRFEKKNTEIINDILVLISGPEPQRQFLEDKLLKEFKNYKGKVIFVKGKIEREQTIEKIGNTTVYNFMTSELLEKTLNESELVISRSGYTTILDLAKLNKKAFFIPTPGQFEQEYLANRLKDSGIVPYCSQDEFSLKQLDVISLYKGLTAFDFEVNYKTLFHLFESE